MESITAPLELLKSLVEIESGTSNTAGVNRVQDRVAMELKKLGFAVQFEANPRGGSGKLLIATLVGEKSQVIDFVTHADTVFEQSSGFREFKWDGKSQFARGPGIIDDKGGIVVALLGLQDYLQTRTRPISTLRFICSPCEEIGSIGLTEKFAELGKKSGLVLGFEPALESGAIIESRRGNRWYHIRIRGQEAHAGRSHAEGVNAGHELAIKLDKLQRLTDYKKDVTVSIGHLCGGQDKYNIVCGAAEAKIDARFSDFKSRTTLDAKIKKILQATFVRSFKGKKKAETKFSIENDCPPFSTSAAAQPLLTAYLKILQKIEKKKVRAEHSGGAADSNYMSREGLIILDGLGPVGSGMHTVEERIFLPSIKTRAQALTDFLNFCDANLSKFV